MLTTFSCIIFLKNIDNGFKTWNSFHCSIYCKLSLMWQRSTLSRAGSAQGSRNAHFINRRQRETQQNDLIRLLQPLTSHIYSHISQFALKHVTDVTDLTDLTVLTQLTKCHEKGWIWPETPVWDVQLHSHLTWNTIDQPVSIQRNQAGHRLQRLNNRD